MHCEILGLVTSAETFPAGCSNRESPQLRKCCGRERRWTVVAFIHAAAPLNATSDCRHRMTIVVLQVKVKPRSKVSELSQSPDGTWVARLKAPPVDGKANEELIALVAERFGVRKAAVTIKAGAAARTKRITVDV